MPNREEFLSELVQLQEELAELRQVSLLEPRGEFTGGWHPQHFNQPPNVALFDDGTGEAFRIQQQINNEREKQEAKVRIQKERRRKRIPEIESRIQVIKKELVASDSVATKARDRSLEARDKWIYEQCLKLVPYETIGLRLKKKPKNWPRIERKQGIRIAAIRYAERHGLSPIPARVKSKRK